MANLTGKYYNNSGNNNNNGNNNNGNNNNSEDGDGSVNNNSSNGNNVEKALEIRDIITMEQLRYARREVYTKPESQLTMRFPRFDIIRYKVTTMLAKYGSLEAIVMWVNGDEWLPAGVIRRGENLKWITLAYPNDKTKHKVDEYRQLYEIIGQIEFSEIEPGDSPENSFNQSVEWIKTRWQLKLNSNPTLEVA